MALDRPACFLVRPHGPLRFGGHPEDLTGVDPFPASDTLFGALVWAMAARDGEQAAGDWVERFASGAPPLLISSGLPYDADGATPFLPRPQRRRQSGPSVEISRKLLKRAEYVDFAALAWFAGDSNEVPRPLGRLLVSADAAIEGGGWRSALVPGVAVDRASSASEVYSVGVTRYSMAIAVYALAEDDGEIENLASLLDLLSVAGIGGRRSRGAGQFHWERIDCPLKLTSHAAGASLSLVWPRPEELNAGILSPPEDFGYRIVERHGWIGSPAWSGERTRTVAMLAEGSYFGGAPASPVGGMADVTPLESRGRHRVYRYGLGLFLDEGLA